MHGMVLEELWFVSGELLLKVDQLKIQDESKYKLLDQNNILTLSTSFRHNGRGSKLLAVGFE